MGNIRFGILLENHTGWQFSQRKLFQFQAYVVDVRCYLWVVTVPLFISLSSFPLQMAQNFSNWRVANVWIAVPYRLRFGEGMVPDIIYATRVDFILRWMGLIGHFWNPIGGWYVIIYMLCTIVWLTFVAPMNFPFKSKQANATETCNNPTLSLNKCASQITFNVEIL